MYGYTRRERALRIRAHDRLEPEAASVFVRLPSYCLVRPQDAYRPSSILKTS
jgi:hypothetical protein